MLRDILEKISQEWLSAKQSSFSGSSMRTIFVNFENEIRKITDLETHSKYLVKASIGQGNWADVPWVAFFDEEITNSTQSGIYPVFLLKSDATGFYLSLIHGTTKLSQEFKPKSRYIEELENRKRLLRTNLDSGWSQSTLELNSTTDTGRSYENASIISKYYDASDLPKNESLITDIKELLSIYRQLKPNILSILNTDSSQVNINNIKESQLLRISKPFLILAGISGTGKSRFVRKQAEQSGGKFKLIPVRPDWHEPSELLGYPSYLTEKPTYHTTEFLQFLFSAWQQIFPKMEITEKGIRLDPAILNQIPPFWLCLDEMNLAPVEQYFADYLAVIESREWLWENGKAEYRCDPLIPSAVFIEFGEQFQLEQGLLDFFKQFGMPLPFNLIVAGTVNMDETTHGFSRKVLDRALSFDFSEFYPNDFAQYFEQKDEPIALSYPVYSSVKPENLPSVDSDGQKSIQFLSALNEILAQTPFKLGYRALNELLLNVVCFNPQTEEELQAVWDDFLMFKLLPRLEGDEDKLAYKEKNVLQALLEILPQQLTIWEQNRRKDFLRQREGEDITIPCRSRSKLEWMVAKLNRSQFTTFWQ